MIENLLKDKKKVGVFLVLVITIVAIGILYLNSGFKELKKNNTESIFVDENVSNNDGSKSDNKGNINNNSNNGKANVNNKSQEVSTANDKNIVVEIKGEVKRPDVYTLNENSIIKDLIELAGGLTENADLSNINRAKKLQNHDLIYIANKNQISSGAQNTNTNLSTNNAESSDKKINLNSANVEELKKIDGVGDSKAKSIIEYREKNGGFKSIDDIKNVSGIGEKMFERIKDQIEV